MIVAGTGHRPPRLNLDYSPKSRKLLRAFAIKQLCKIDGITQVISGMAQGWDQALAGAAIILNIPLIAAIPFEGMESKWPTEAQELYKFILGQADEVKIVCTGGYAAHKFIERDRYMVQNCNLLLALWDGGEKGGTAATVRFARDWGVEVKNLWETYIDETEARK